MPCFKIRGRSAEKPEVGGAELASEPLSDLDKVLMASLVRLPDFFAVEFGSWTVTGEGLVGPPMPLLFEAGHIAKVREAAEKAVRALPAATFDQEGMAQLVTVDEGGLIRAPDGAAYVTLAVADGSGLAEIPMEKADALPRVLAAAERQLAEWGVVPLAGDLRN